MCTGNPVSLENLLSIFFKRAPPPVKTIPYQPNQQIILVEYFLSASLIPFTICFKISFKASAVSSSVIFTSFGVPDLKSLTFYSISVIISWYCSSNFFFYFFSSTVSNHQIVFFSHIINHSTIHCITCNSQ